MCLVQGFVELTDGGIFGELKLKTLSVELPKFPLLRCAARILNLLAAKSSRLHTIKLKYNYEIV